MSFYTRFRSSAPQKLRYAVAVILFVVVSGAFSGLADEVRDGDTLPGDTYILRWINDNLSHPRLDSVISIGTDAGGVPALTLLTVGLTIWLIRKKAYSKALFLGLVMIGTGAANTTLKLLFERQRPDLWQRLVEETTFSFPSGHAMGSMAIGLTLVVLAWHTKWRAAVIALTVGYVLFIGFSRLYLGVHYPTDIAAGWLLAAGWVGMVYLLVQVKGRSPSVTGDLPKQKQ